MDFSDLVPREEIEGEDPEETQEILAMLSRAKDYITSFSWCPAIKDVRLGLGIGGVVAVFLVQFEEPVGDDEYLWVVEGDLPSAYIVIDEASDAISALLIYCELMEGWANAVSQGLPLDDVFPVRACPNAKHAAMLRSRIGFIRSQVLPRFQTTES